MFAEFARREKVINVTAAKQLVREDSGSLITNLGASGSVTVTLPVDAEVGDKFTFRAAAAQTLVIAQGQATESFIVSGAVQTANHSISFNVINAAVACTKISSTAWICGASGTITVN